MKFALAMGDPLLEREVLNHLGSSGAQVVRRCLVAAEANDVPSDVELIIDASFHTKHRDQLRRQCRVIRSISDLTLPGDESRGKADHLILFTGSSGGVGTTTATLYSAAQSPGRTLVIDADLWHPNAQLFVGSPRELHSGGLMAALEQGSVQVATQQWGESVWVLGGIDAPSRRHQIDEDAWIRLLDDALANFDEVRIDLGNQLTDEHPVISHAAARASHAVVITAAHPASAIAAPDIAKLLSGQGIQVHHVINMMEPGPIGVTAYRMLSSHAAEGIAVTIPRDDQSYAQAFVDGEALSKKGAASRAITQLNERLAHRDVTEPARLRQARPGRLISFTR